MKTEFELDEALAEAFRSDSRFSAWFLAQTLFRGADARYVWGRCDNPYSRVTLTIQDGKSQEPEQLTAECETDVLVVYEAANGGRLALHIENKLASGSFTPNQPELYQARKEQWKGRSLLGNYTDAVCALVAPRVFLDRNFERAGVFDARISHEDISEYVPAFRDEP